MVVMIKFIITTLILIGAQIALQAHGQAPEGPFGPGGVCLVAAEEENVVRLSSGGLHANAKLQEQEVETDQGLRAEE